MGETLRSSGENGSINSGRESYAQQIRALEFYISGMMDHPVGMPWASINRETGQLEVIGDSGDVDPTVRLTTFPGTELVEGFLRRDGSVTFNPETNLLELHGSIKRLNFIE